MNWDVDTGQRPLWCINPEDKFEHGNPDRGCAIGGPITPDEGCRIESLYQDLQGSMKKAIFGVCGAKMQKSNNTRAY
ncbi:hypothetical protein ATOBIA_N09030 [Atopobiaceae bacterium P1]|uniref:Uncharacterized protein n=1 Tax=Leptogranulimonas caecicola TaxID=2894156 RepID=A0AAU9CWP9_9ACTN|nr:hypothetical protein ATOBIA_N09030 [Atopobiaceae bacterium P1]BDC90943.1 hypothetical protein ATTO_08150 [Leptogranulimonas caecicola]